MKSGARSQWPILTALGLAGLAVGILIFWLSGESGFSQQGAVTKPPVDHADLEEVTPPDLDTVTERDVCIPMRDGTRLVADITLPAESFAYLSGHRPTERRGVATLCQARLRSSATTSVIPSHSRQWSHSASTESWKGS